MRLIEAGRGKNTKKSILDVLKLLFALGGLDSTIVDPRDVLRPAITAHAPSIIPVHNHPSGDPTPSEQDISLTRQLCMSGRIVDVTILDHIIIGLPGYVSLKEQKLL